MKAAILLIAVITMDSNQKLPMEEHVFHGALRALDMLHLSRTIVEILMEPVQYGALFLQKV